MRHERGHSSWEAPAAFACFVTAVVVGIAGAVLTTSWILNAQAHSTLYTVGLALLILALPIVILGGHFLDLMDRKREMR